MLKIQEEILKTVSNAESNANDQENKKKSSKR